MDQPQHLTQILREWSGGSTDALERLMPFIYVELHKQAARILRNERNGHTLQSTALIHETYLKLIDQREANWANRTHFFAISARLMRRVLIDHARSKRRDKRGGSNAVQVTLDESILVQKGTNIDLIALDQALDTLAKIDEQQVRVVELRYFSGLSIEDTAVALNVSRTTVVKDWRMARAWLHRELTR